MVKRSFIQTVFDILFLSLLFLLFLAAQPDGLLQEVVAQCHSCTRWSIQMADEGKQMWAVIGQVLLAFRDVLEKLGGGFW